MYMPRQQSLGGQDPATLLYAQPAPPPPQQQQQQQQPLSQSLQSPPPPAPAPSPSKHAQAMPDQQQQQHNNPSHPGDEAYPTMQETSYPGQQPPVQRTESTGLTPPPDAQAQPQQQQQDASGAREAAQQPSFRALPLLAADLPHTTITVSHSFVRPNDRGKEVLSFVVSVHPGSGKDGWKVEKMYSDVLGLDQRVRNSVGKGVGKRIASLPEGKLWKDHAPAKVDQRKVCVSFPSAHAMFILLNQKN
jgi:RalA-binding protein 1